jgi:uncharacterized protein
MPAALSAAPFQTSARSRQHRICDFGGGCRCRAIAVPCRALARPVSCAANMETEMATAAVTGLNPTRGYGFIQPSGGGGKDAFVPISAVEQAGLSLLNEGQPVAYEIESTRRRVGGQSQGQITVLPAQPAGLSASECRACGACCSFSPEWPRFSLESEADLDRIPREYVDADLGRMRCRGNRCAALVGEVGIATACAVYAVRPDVCRACVPGDESCQMARRRLNL